MEHQLRDAYYERVILEGAALKLLINNPENTTGWRILEIALKGRDRIEYYLDLLNGKQADQLQAYRELEDADE